MDVRVALLLLLAAALPSAAGQTADWCPAPLVEPISGDGGPGKITVVLENDHERDEVRTCVYDADGRKRLDRTYSLDALERFAFTVRPQVDLYDLAFGTSTQKSPLSVQVNLTGCASGSMTLVVQLTHVGTMRSWSNDGPHCDAAQSAETPAAATQSPTPSPHEDAQTEAPATEALVGGSEAEMLSARRSWIGESRMPLGMPPTNVAAGLVLLLGVVVALWKFAGSFGFLTLYSRLVEPDVLRHTTRSSLLQLVTAEPGIHLEEIGRRLELSQSVLRHHVRVLLGARVLREERVGRTRCVFAMSAHDPVARRAAVLLRKPAVSAFLQACRDQPNSSLSTIAQAARLALPHASKIARRLLDAGLLVRDESVYPPRLVARSITA